MSSTDNSLTWTSRSMLYVRRCSPSDRVLDNSAPRNNGIVTRESVLVSSPIRSPTQCLKVMKLRGRTYLFSYDGKKDWIEVSKFNKNVSVHVERETRETDCKPTETESPDELEFHPDFNLQPGTEWADVCSISEVYQNERADVKHAESTEFDLECDFRYNLPKLKDHGEKPPLLDSVDLEIQFDPRFNLEPGTSWFDDCAGGDCSEQADRAKFHEENHLSGAQDSAETIQDKDAHRKSVLREAAAIATLWKTTEIATVHARQLKDSIAVSYSAVIDATKSIKNIAADSLATADPSRWVDVCGGGDYCEQDGAQSYKTDLSESSDIENHSSGALDSVKMKQDKDAHRKSVIREVAALASLWKTSNIAKAHASRFKGSIAVECNAALDTTRSTEDVASESSVALDATRPTTGKRPATSLVDFSAGDEYHYEQDNAAKYHKDISVSRVNTLLGAWDSKEIMLEMDAHRKSVIREVAAIASLWKTTKNTTAHVRRVNICIPTTHAIISTEEIAAESPAAPEITRSTKGIATESLTDSDKSITDGKAGEGSIALNVMRSTKSIAAENPTALNATSSSDDVVEENPTVLNTTRFTESITAESPITVNATRSTEGKAEERPVALVTTRSTENFEERPAALDPTLYTEGIYAEGSTTLDATRSEESIAFKAPADVVTTRSTERNYSESPATVDATRSIEGIDAKGTKARGADWSIEGVAAKTLTALVQTKSAGGIVAENVTERPAAVGAATFTEDIAFKKNTARDATTTAKSNIAETHIDFYSSRSTKVSALESPAGPTATTSAESNDATRRTESVVEETNTALDATEGTDAEGTRAFSVIWSTENVAAKSHTAIVQTKFLGAIVTENVAVHHETKSTRIVAAERLSATRTRDDIGGRVIRPTGEDVRHLETSSPLVPCHSTTGHVKDTNSSQRLTPLVKRFSNELPYTVIPFVHWSDICLHSCAIRSKGNGATVSTSDLNTIRSTGKVITDTPAGIFATRFTEGEGPESKSALGVIMSTSGIGDRAIGYTRKKVGDKELSPPKASCHQIVSEMDTNSCEVPRPIIKRFNKLPYAVIPVVSWSDICLHSGRELDGHSENESMCDISDDDGVFAVDDDDDDEQRHGFFFCKVPQVNPALLSILLVVLFIIFFLYKVFFSALF